MMSFWVSQQALQIQDKLRGYERRLGQLSESMKIVVRSEWDRRGLSARSEPSLKQRVSEQDEYLKDYDSVKQTLGQKEQTLADLRAEINSLREDNANLSE